MYKIVVQASKIAKFTQVSIYSSKTHLKYTYFGLLAQYALMFLQPNFEIELEFIALLCPNLLKIRAKMLKIVKFTHVSIYYK